LDRRARQDDPVFGVWGALMRLPEGDFARAARSVVESWPGPLNPLVRAALAGPLNSRADVAHAYGVLLKRAWDDAKPLAPSLLGAFAPLRELVGSHAKAQRRQDDAARQLLEILTGPDSPCHIPRSQTWHYMSRGDKDAFARKRNELDRLAVKSPHAPPRAMVLNDLPELHDPRVFVRGNPSQLGDAVPRQFLRILAGEERRPFPNGSGRLDLARAITAPDNPLTARVLVNRVWMHHFGEPLVSTPSDFGTRSTPPTHPELLDHLAAEFMAPSPLPLSPSEGERGRGEGVT